MHPIDLIRQHKAQQQFKAATKKPTQSPMGATEIGFDANQGKAVISIQDGGTLYANSITNGYRGPGEAVRVDRSGAVVQSDSMPRVKSSQTKTETKKVYGKLQILYGVHDGRKITYYVGGFQREPIKVGTIAATQTLLGAFNDFNPVTDFTVGWQAISLENNGLADFTVGYFRVVQGKYQRRFVRWRKGASNNLYEANSDIYPFPDLYSANEPDDNTGVSPNITGMKNTSKFGSASTSRLWDDRFRFSLGQNDSLQETIVAEFWSGQTRGQDLIDYQETQTYISNGSSGGGGPTRSTEDILMTGQTSILPEVKRNFYFQRNTIFDLIADPDISLQSSQFNFTQRLIHELDLSTALVVRANWSRDFNGTVPEPNQVNLNINTLALIDSEGDETPFAASLKISDLQAFLPGEGANAENETISTSSILGFWNLHRKRLYTFNPATEIVKIWSTESEQPETLKPQYYPPKKGARIISAQYRP